MSKNTNFRFLLWLGLISFWAVSLGEDPPVSGPAPLPPVSPEVQAPADTSAETVPLIEEAVESNKKTEPDVPEEVAVPALGIPPKEVSESLPEANIEWEGESGSDSQSEWSLLSFDARIDSKFSTGNGVVQGFSLPSIRLSAWGDLSSQIGYRLSLGQTREFSTVLLPQILPVEGFVDLSPQDRKRRDVNRVGLRFGLFTPELVPWWTPDLSGVPMPTYHRIHQHVLLARDLGAQIHYHSAQNLFSAAIGVFNGIGILAQNTNNSKAINLSLKLTAPIGGWELVLGSGGYLRFQSSPGNINYRKEWIEDLYVGLVTNFFELYGELIIGEFRTSSTVFRPSGGAVMALLHLSKAVHIFSRAEFLSNSPLGGSAQLQHYEAGPVIRFHDNLNLFITYSYLSGDGTPTHDTSFLFRLDV